MLVGVVWQMFPRVKQQDLSSWQDSTTRPGLIIALDWHEEMRLSNLSLQTTIYPEKSIMAVSHTAQLNTNFKLYQEMKLFCQIWI